MGLLDGKVAIVTGAGHGIGRGEAVELARQGARVVVNDLGTSVRGEGADVRAADEVVKVITERGGEAVANYDDVADWDGAKRLVDQAVEAFGRLDVLVNNAGISRDSMIFKMSEDDFDSVVRVHLKGTFAPTRHAAVYWRDQAKRGEQPRAAIVNTVSSAGLQGNPGQANYGSAKAGIAALTIISSLELAQYGVRANAVAPGGLTRISASINAGQELKHPDEYADDEFSPSNPGNSAPMVAWLASDASMPVTGQVFRASRDSITHYEPWRFGATVETRGGSRMWKAEEIGPAVHATIFRTRHPGLQLP